MCKCAYNALKWLWCDRSACQGQIPLARLVSQDNKIGQDVKGNARSVLRTLDILSYLVTLSIKSARGICCGDTVQRL